MLDPYFNPRGVAVIGASTDPHKLGYGVVRNLVEYHYRGSVYPVNPTAREILGHRCYSSISGVPDPVELAIIIVPAQSVTDTVKECGDRGIRHVVVVSGGFGETGPDGAEREEELAQAGRAYGMRIIGPNCIGTIDTHTPVNTTFVIGMPRPGDIGFVSQSGALVAAVIDWARGAAVGFSRLVSLGNQVDVTETEMIASLGEDPQTRVITAYIEGLKDGRHFMEVTAEVARRKPVIALKAGRGESGARAVASHTGALAGTLEAYDAAFRDSGVLRAHTMEELFDWARALAWQPLPRGDRVAVLTNAGGPAILAVDALEAAGLRLAPFTEDTRNHLRPRIPAAGSLENPVDILAGSGPGTYAVALDALLSDPTVDAALVIQAPQDWFLPTSLAEVISEVAAAHDKPVLTSLMGLASLDRALEILHQKRIPNFAFPERAAFSIAAMVQRREWLDMVPSMSVEPKRGDTRVATPAIRSEDWSTLLDAYGIPVPVSRVAVSEKEAVAIANDLGYPVVLKTASRTVVHKTDVGGVVLDIGDDESLRTEFRNVCRVSPDGDEAGVLVQKMYPPGVDLIVGTKRDEQFGPLVLVGSGGTEVELLRDVKTGIAPLTEKEAEQILARTRAGVKLRGWRGSPPCDLRAAVRAVVQLAQIAADFPSITTLEINPLRVFEHGCMALDIRGSRSVDPSAKDRGKSLVACE
ncbi:MAG: acetate--CoA ligase family protein [Ignavibacteria bacterium]|nr:acetate--CoA ligase family protein [Ignavibacteria bacterium]